MDIDAFLHPVVVLGDNSKSKLFLGDRLVHSCLSGVDGWVRVVFDQLKGRNVGKEVVVVAVVFVSGCDKRARREKHEQKLHEIGCP